MSLFTKCPSCGLPRNPEDAENPCSLCGWFLGVSESLEKPDELLPDEPEPVTVTPSIEPQTERNPFPKMLLALPVAVVLFGVIGFVVRKQTRTPETPEIVQNVAPNGVEEKPVDVPPPKKEQPPEPTPKKPKEEIAAFPGNNPDIKMPEVKQPEMKMPELAPPPKVVVMAPPGAGEVLDGENRVLNRPEGEYELEALDGLDNVTIKGKVRTLIIKGMAGRSILDATELQAEKVVIVEGTTGECELKANAVKEIDFRGSAIGASKVTLTCTEGNIRFSTKPEAGNEGSKIDNSAKVKLTAKNVEFHSRIDGGSVVEVNAPQGVVKFPNPTTDEVSGSRICGGAKVNINATEVDFQGWLDGGAHVRMTLNGSSKLSFKEMRGGAHLFYKKANDSDPEPKVSTGEILGGAQVKPNE